MLWATTTCLEWHGTNFLIRFVPHTRLVGHRQGCVPLIHAPRFCGRPHLPPRHCLSRVQIPLERRTYAFRSNFPIAYFRLEGKLVRWEDGVNHRMSLSRSKSALRTSTTSDTAHTVVWWSIFVRSDYTWKCAGFAVPVFSLRSESSNGVGDFNDLRLAVELAHMVGLKVIQLLPVNDTSVSGTWHDSYPYGYRPRSTCRNSNAP